MKLTKEKVTTYFVEYIDDWDTAIGSDNVVDKIVDYIKTLPKVLSDKGFIIDKDTEYHFMFSCSGYEDTVQIYVVTYQSGYKLIDIRMPRKLQDDLGDKVREEITEELIKLNEPKIRTR